MLILDDVRNSVVHLIAQRRRDVKNERQSFMKKIQANHWKNLVSIMGMDKLRFFTKARSNS